MLFNTVICSILVANFTRSPGAGRCPGKRMRVEKALWLLEPLTVFTNSDGQPGWWCADRQMMGAVSASLSLMLYQSGLYSFPLYFQRITLSAHTLDCKLKECKQNTCYKRPVGGRSSHSQVFILGPKFPTEKKAIVCIRLHMVPRSRQKAYSISLMDDLRWLIKGSRIYALYAKC